MPTHSLRPGSRKSTRAVVHTVSLYTNDSLQNDHCSFKLRGDMLTIDRVVRRTVDAEGAIVYQSNHYELPQGFRGRTLTVRDDGRRLRVFDVGALICEYELLNGRSLRAKRTHAAEARLRMLAPIRVERRALEAYEGLIG